MMSSSTHNGGQRVADRGNKSLSMEVVKLLKTQDAAYLRTVAQKTRRARERLEEEFVLGGEGEGHAITVLGKRDQKGGNKVVWVESREEQRRWGGESPNTEEATAGREKTDRDDEDDIEDASKVRHAPRKALIEAQKLALQTKRVLRKQHKREQETRRSKLEALKIREKDLMTAEHELEMQRARMSASIGGVTKAGLKWKIRERKR